MKRLSQLGYCWKCSYDVRKALVKTKILLHNESHSMHVRKNSRTGVLISFNLKRPGWIPATSLRNFGKGRRLLV